MKSRDKVLVSFTAGILFGVTATGLITTNKLPIIKGNSVVVSEVKVINRNICKYTLSQPNEKEKLENKFQIENVCGVYTPASELVFCIGYNERRKK